MMHEVLSSLQNLNEKSREIFQRLETACSDADAKILHLEDRLSAAAARVEAARGSTVALKVESARTFCGRGKPQLRTAHLVVGEDVLLSVRQSANLPEDLDSGLPSAATSAEELARVSRSVTHHCTLATPDSSLKSQNEKLLPTSGRLSSVSELFLLNSSEQPYRVRHEVDNLAELEDDAFSKPRTRSDSVRGKASQPQNAKDRMQSLDLEEDEPERATEDLRFRPRPATAEVTFDLPQVLPDLGHVAHIVWTEGASEDRPAWDVAPADLARRASMAKPRPVPKRQAPPPPRASQPAVPAIVPAAPAAPVAPAAPAAPAVPQATVAKPKTSPPPPAPKAKGDGKGKGKAKGKGKGPPPPAKKPSSTGPPAKPPAQKAAPAGKAAMFADIRAAPKLRKVAPPKERSGAAVGRVV